MNINVTAPINGSSGSAGQAMPAPPPPKEATGTDLAQQQPSKAKEVSLAAQEAKELTEGLNDMMDGLQTSIGFSVHEGKDSQVVVQIKDRSTNELIKQIPSEELLAIKEKMEEFTGLIFSQTA